MDVNKNLKKFEVLVHCDINYDLTIYAYNEDDAKDTAIQLIKDETREFTGLIECPEIKEIKDGK